MGPEYIVTTEKKVFMRGKFNIFLLGVSLGVLLVALIYFADDIRKFIISRKNWINHLMLIMTFINTSLIIYILRLTKNNNNRS